MSALPSPIARIAFSGILAPLLAAAVWLLGGASPQLASAQGESCPNAESRVGYASQLPDCRAYEQVSPVDKNGNHIGIELSDEPFGALPTPDGDRVLFESKGSFAGAPSANFRNSYAGIRNGGNWQTLPLTPPVGTPSVQVLNINVWGATTDLSKQLVMSYDVLAPGAVEGDDNVYIHDSTDGSYELVFSKAGSTGGPPLIFAGASKDGSRFFFTTRSTPLDSTPPPAPVTGTFAQVDLYEFSDGELKLVGVLPDGTASPLHSGPGPGWGNTNASGAGGRTVDLSRHAISSDGSRVYWSPTDYSPDGTPRPLYLREDGQTTVVSERESDGSTQSANFFHATPDGALAFLISEAGLTSDASPAGTDLYRYDADARDLTNLTPTADSADVVGVFGVSEDGGTIYFEATGVLAPGAIAGEHNLYVLRDDEIRLIATSSAGLDADKGVGDWQVSPDGSHFGFLFEGALTGPNPQSAQTFRQAYLYGFEEDSLVCASCLPGGATPTGEVHLTEKLSTYLVSSQGLTRSVLDNGSFFFSSPDPLVDRDTNGNALDVYEYSAGEVHLISTGQSPKDSFLLGAGRSGADVFLLTLSQLASQDRDDLYDVYDARVDGGLISQNPSPPPLPCQGNACQSESSNPPAEPQPGSSWLSGQGNVASSAGCQNLKGKADRKARKAKGANKAAKKAKRSAKKTKRIAKRAHGKRAKKLGRKATRLKRKAKKAGRKARSSKRAAKRTARVLNDCRNSQ